jgi:hypothetical protein
LDPFPEQGLWEPVCNDLLELGGQVSRIFTAGAESLSLESGEIKRCDIAGLNDPTQSFLPFRVDLAHVVEHVLGPVGEMLGLTTEFPEGVALPVHTLQITHELRTWRVGLMGHRRSGQWTWQWASSQSWLQVPVLHRSWAGIETVRMHSLLRQRTAIRLRGAVERSSHGSHRQ